MTNSLSGDQVTNLFSMRSATDVEAFLHSLIDADLDGWDWFALGGRRNNAGSVELVTEPGPPIIERITNGIDALLELGFQKANCPDIGPTSPRAAAEQWFAIKGGTLSELREDRTLIGHLAPNVEVEVHDSGEAKAPTISVSDKGIGQHPMDLPDTILSLGESNKIGKQYLCGAYGQGGSSSFAWCKFTIIISRKRPEHTNGRPDLVGWTIVRQYDSPELKIHTYQYLVTAKKDIPTFPPTLLKTDTFEFGTYICHVSYRLERLSSRWSLVGYRYFDNLLFDPVLPYTIRDRRAPPPFNRNMAGARSRLLEAPIEYANEYRAELGADGSLAVRYWLFKEKRRREQGEPTDEGVSIDSYLEAAGSTRTIILTLNGQRHAYLDKSFIKESRYSLLADSLLVQVDCDELSRQIKKGLFPATRSGIVSGERRLELIEDCVKKALEDDDNLRQIQDQRVRRLLATVDEQSETEVRKLLERLISVTKPSEGPGTKVGTGTGQVPPGQPAFRPKDPPTYFKFVEEEALLTIEPGSQRVIDIVTDGPDDLFTRRRHRAKLALETLSGQSVTMHAGRLHEGRIGVTVIARVEAAVGARCQLRCLMEMEGGVYFPPSQRPCQVVPPPPPYTGAEPPITLEIVAGKGGNVRLRQGKLTRVTVRTDCRDDLLARAEKPGRFEMSCSIPGCSMEARRGPHCGEIEAYFRVPESVATETVGNLTAKLILADSSTLADSKPCIVISPPSLGRQVGKAPEQRSNYKLIDVWRQPPAERPDSKTWDDLGWDETHVGKHELVPDPENADKELLLLYVNMDNDEMSKAKENFLRRLGEPAARRLEIRYKAYIGYHLWLHFERSRPTAVSGDVSGNGNGGEVQSEDARQQERNLYEEMGRVSKTVLLAMRSERDLTAALRAG